MSLYRLFRIQQAGGYIDRSTRAERYPRLRNFSILCIGAAVLAAFVGWPITSALLALIGLLALFLFGLAAKNYGSIAVGAIVLFIGGCVAMMAVGTGPSQPRPELVNREERPVQASIASASAPPVLPDIATKAANITQPPANETAEPLVATSSGDVPERPAEKPAHQYPTVYHYDRGSKIYHAPGCAQITSNTFTAGTSFGKFYGYTPHTCIPTTLTSVGRAGLSVGSGGAVGIYSSSARTDTAPAQSPGRTVNVRGYTRSDGKYVAPHTRSAPKRD